MLVVATNLDNVWTSLRNAGIQKEGDKCLDVAAINSVKQTVLAGDTKLIDGFREYCANNGLITHQLDSRHAFHSRQLDPMLKKYEEIAHGINFQPPEINYIYM